MSYILANSTFQITSARLRSVKPFKLERPFYDSTMGPFANGSLTTLTLKDADGTEGEAPLASDAILENSLLPRLIKEGEKPRAYPELFHDLYWLIRNAGFRGPAAQALAGIDHALHDLAARRAGLPLHHMLGATRDEALAYGSGGSTHLTTEELVDEMKRYVDMGFSCLKMKVGKNFGREMAEDVLRVAAVRNAIGPYIGLAVDANQVWTPIQAYEFAVQVAPYNIAWFEEPVHSADLSALRELAAMCPIYIAMGESERTWRVFPSLIEHGAKHLQPIPSHLTSVADWLAVRDLTAQYGLSLSSGGNSWKTCQLIATADPYAMTEILMPLIAPLESLYSIKPKLEGGKFLLPTEPGLSCRVDWERLEKEGRVEKEKSF